MTEPITGPNGRADPIPFNPLHPTALETVAIWLIESPGWTPAWNKYNLWAVRLRDNIPGFDPPKRHFDGATHEIMLVALHPDHPATVETMSAPDYQISWLTPPNLVYQVEATDSEAAELVAKMAEAIVVHGYAPEPPLGYRSFHDNWAMAIVKTLAHIRGEEHAP